LGGHSSLLDDERIEAVVPQRTNIDVPRQQPGTGEDVRDLLLRPGNTPAMSIATPPASTPRRPAGGKLKSGLDIMSIELVECVRQAKRKSLPTYEECETLTTQSSLLC